MLAGCAGRPDHGRFSRWGLKRRCIPPEPRLFEALCVALPSKYNRYSSLARLVRRAPRRSRRSRDFLHRLIRARCLSEVAARLPISARPTTGHTSDRIRSRHTRSERSCDVRQGARRRRHSPQRVSMRTSGPLAASSPRNPIRAPSLGNADLHRSAPRPKAANASALARISPAGIRSALSVVPCGSERCAARPARPARG